MLVAVEETAAAAGTTGETRPTRRASAGPGIDLSLRRLLPAALLALLPMLAFAQIVAGGPHAPNVIQTQNGIDQVNINRASGAGVSVNSYSRFDVQSRGAILNNSPSIVQSQQGGMINGNPNFGPGAAAKVIVNQVNSPTASQLNGYVEVAGQRPEPVGRDHDRSGLLRYSADDVQADHQASQAATGAQRPASIDDVTLDGGAGIGGSATLNLHNENVYAGASVSASREAGLGIIFGMIPDSIGKTADQKAKDTDNLLQGQPIGGKGCLFGVRGGSNHAVGASTAVEIGVDIGGVTKAPNPGGNQTFVSSGNSQTAALRIARVMSRSQNDVLGAYLQLSRRFGDSFIDDTTIPTQARNNTFLEWGATDRHYLGAAQFDGTLAYRQGIGGLGATADPYAEGPTYRFHMAVVDANLSVPFNIGTQPLRYVTTVHGQFTNDTLFYIDDLTIGSRYTVRGFDGETMLAAERGFYWRNELQWPVFQTGQTLYAGIDYGRVFGPNTATLVGTQLAGAVMGIRGGLPAKYVGVSYDLFAGTPIYKPSGFPTARWTVGFQMTAAF
uniref:Filamentous hemagglutinin family outer membrane protein n=1 Tax=Burkholderia sp. (strain CCGE1003) TaxID=640512 RepID=E1T656_BURSG